MSILVVGSVALDSVKTPFGETTESLGGSAVHFSAAASFFSKIRLVGVIGEDFPKEEIAFLEKRGVDFAGLKVEKGKTFRWKGEYGFDLNVAKTLETHLNVFSQFSPVIPEEFRKSDVLFLGNIHPALQMKVLEQVERPKLVALDTMNFWIEGETEALKKVISKVDLLVINEGEARELTKIGSLVAAARTIQSWGVKIVVIKRGEYGALLFHPEGIFSAPGLPLETVKDPTGAGDSFAGGMIGYLESHPSADGFKMETFKQAVIVGSAMASFNVEDFSCRRLKSLTPKEIGQRIALFKKLSHFEDVSI
jgi:sugar/nucleoside kinase (ribokinase family)